MEAGAIRGAAARIAVGLGLASVAVSVYWTAGGTALLDTVGGQIEELARDRSAGGLLLGVAAVAVKTVGALLPLTLRRGLGRRADRLLWGLCAAAAAVLVLWGGANVVVGGLVLGGVLDQGGPVDEHALRWHVGLWDLWFLLWGVALAVATIRAGATMPCPSRSGHRPRRARRRR